MNRMYGTRFKMFYSLNNSVVIIEKNQMKQRCMTQKETIKHECDKRHERDPKHESFNGKQKELIQDTEKSERKEEVPHH